MDRLIIIMAKILVVDDEAEFLEVQCALLRHVGHDVVSACSGSDGMERLKDGTFSLVMTDIMMPVMDGFQFIMALRKKFPDLKVIAFTGGPWIQGPMYLKHASRLGAVGTLQKPFTGRQLFNAVNNILGLDGAEIPSLVRGIYQ